MNQFFKAFLPIFIGLSSITAQELEKKWSSKSSENAYNTIEFKDGEFNFSSNSKINLQGDYMYQNNLLVLYHNDSINTISRYKISELTDSTFVFSGKELNFNLISKVNEATKAEIKPVIPIIPSQGFSIDSLWRGVLGMFSLIFIAFLFSSNRKAINWKVVGIGLTFQLIIAIGVLKVPFIKSIFEFVGSLFIDVLEFTKAGSKFLFEGLVVDMDTFGFIFAFQVLPTILFFSALTSVLFYLGIIQKVVKGMAWLLSKALKISGAESLSVAGNIFLGQTEAPLLIKAYLEKMTKSEILCLMVGGMATIAGGVLAAFIGFLGGESEAGSANEAWLKEWIIEGNAVRQAKPRICQSTRKRSAPFFAQDICAFLAL